MFLILNAIIYIAKYNKQNCREKGKTSNDRLESERQK